MPNMLYEYGLDPLEAADRAMLEYAPDKYHLVNGRVYLRPEANTEQPAAEKEKK